MNTSVDVQTIQEAKAFDDILGALSTTNTFYPFDEAMSQPIAILKSFLLKLEEMPSVLPKVADKESVISQTKVAISLLSNVNESPEKKAEQLLTAYLTATIASHQLQDHFEFTTAFWSKFPSRLDGILFGWALGWHNPERESKLKARVVDLYRLKGVRLDKSSPLRPSIPS